MDKSQVTELIQRWRVLKGELTNKGAELESARKALQEVEDEHAKMVQQWDLEKETIHNTSSAIEAQVTNKKEEVQRMARETEELLRKVEERRRRTEEHLRVLNKRMQVVTMRTKEAEEKDAGARERLATFRKSRDEARAQLLALVKKHEAAIPQEQAAHEQKVRTMKSRIAETAAAIEAEAKSWALEQAMKEWKEKSNARKHVLDEVAAAEESKDLWADLLQEANGIHIQENMKTLAELRAMVSA
jgi:chromosome segregation ATPase